MTLILFYHLLLEKQEKIEEWSKNRLITNNKRIIPIVFSKKKHAGDSKSASGMT